MISFVILNYNSFLLTKECINKIRLNKSNYKFSIVVVDNNTLNNLEKEELETLVDKVIINEENLGFAKGNNVGINYCKKEYNPQLICVLNSDCYINEDFIEKVFDIYNQDKFHLFGPKILSPDNLSRNPFPAFKTYNEIVNQIKYYEKLDRYYNNSFMYLILSLYLKLKPKKKNNDMNGLEKEYNIPLHGCCIVFSKEYFNKYDDCFYNDTFLFHEEEFLYYRVLKDNLVSLYDPSVVVYHMEGGSTNNSNKRKKMAFINKYRIDSLKKLIKIMDDDKNKENK